VPFVTALGVVAHLEAWGVQPARIVELDWWESHTLPGTDVTVTAAPSQHYEPSHTEHVEPWWRGVDTIALPMPHDTGQDHAHAASITRRSTGSRGTNRKPSEPTGSSPCRIGASPCC
jgi:L-ascorbate metabolism protein UlaG (beta-lactamase superfamily)